MRRQSIVAMSVLAVLGAVAARATEVQVHWTCPERIQAICDARKLTSETERTQALLRLFPDALQSADEAVREAAFGVLGTLSHQGGFDPRPLREALVGFDKPQDGDRGARLIDYYEFVHSPHEARLQVYMTAITQGAAQYGSVSNMERATALELGAREGMRELRSQMGTRYHHLTLLS